MKQPIKINTQVTLTVPSGKLTEDGYRFLSDLVRAIGDLSFLESFAATVIADKDETVNTTGKRKGRFVWDETNHRIMVANGSGATDAWYIADGSASVTPS